jgi:hypothetical protein
VNIDTNFNQGPSEHFPRDLGIIDKKHMSAFRGAKSSFRSIPAFPPIEIQAIEIYYDHRSPISQEGQTIDPGRGITRNRPGSQENVFLAQNVVYQYFEIQAGGFHFNCQGVIGGF